MVDKAHMVYRDNSEGVIDKTKVQELRLLLILHAFGLLFILFKSSIISTTNAVRLSQDLMLELYQY